MTRKLMRIREERPDIPIAKIVEVYTRVSGEADRTYAHLVKGHKVSMWTPLEDMALMEPDNSMEYLTLLQEKGWLEISRRKTFLKVQPVIEQEIAKID